MAKVTAAAPLLVSPRTRSPAECSKSLEGPRQISAPFHFQFGQRAFLSMLYSWKQRLGSRDPPDSVLSCAAHSLCGWEPHDRWSRDTGARLLLLRGLDSSSSPTTKGSPLPRLPSCPSLAHSPLHLLSCGCGYSRRKHGNQARGGLLPLIARPALPAE